MDIIRFNKNRLNFADAKYILIRIFKKPPEEIQRILFEELQDEIKDIFFVAYDFRNLPFKHKLSTFTYIFTKKLRNV